MADELDPRIYSGVRTPPVIPPADWPQEERERRQRERDAERRERAAAASE